MGKINKILYCCLRRRVDASVQSTLILAGRGSSHYSLQRRVRAFRISYVGESLFDDSPHAVALSGHGVFKLFMFLNLNIFFVYFLYIFCIFFVYFLYIFCIFLYIFCIFFVYFLYIFLVELECVGHSFANVAHFDFLRDVWIRELPQLQERYQLSHPSPSNIEFENKFRSGQVQNETPICCFKKILRKRVSLQLVPLTIYIRASGSQTLQPQWLERLTANAEVATVLVRSQHPSTHWNVRGGR